MQKATIFDLATIYKNYMKDFPKSERKPFLMILKNQYITNKSDILVLKENKTVLAYAIAIKESTHNCVLLDYLATISAGRSKGYGTKMIEGLKQFYHDKDGIIIEIEECGKGDTAEENINRDRRKAFYEKNGFLMQAVHLVLFGVQMHIMYLPIKRAEPSVFVGDVLMDIYLSAVGKRWGKLYHKNVVITKKQTNPTD